MPSLEPRRITKFDLFVVVVVLGYLWGAVQSSMRGEVPRLRFAPSSELYQDSAPAEWPTGAALTLLPVESEAPAH